MKGFAGVLGWPLEHTLSPTLHNAAFRRMHIDWVYLAWPVPPEALGDAVAGLRALGCRGANITMPHKEAVVAHLDELSGDAAAVGAVNTIQEVAGKLVGHNTDVDGFREFLAGDAGVDAGGKRVLVLGAGGAARAVVKALSDLGCADVIVAAREPARAEALRELGPDVRVEGFDRAAACVDEVEIVVNATPMGAGGGEDPVPAASFTTRHVVVDLLYHPPSTILVERARAAGAAAWGGIGVLVHQAAASFKIWTGQPAPVEIMSAAALHALGVRRPS